MNPPTGPELAGLQRERDRLALRVAQLESAEAERARVAEALRESEERFRTLVGNVPGTVYRCEFDPPFRDVFLSEGVIALTGYPAAEFMRPGPLTFGDLTLPEDQERVNQAVRQAVEQGSTFEVRYRMRHADGSIHWMYDQGRVARDAGGTPRWIDGVVLDITDRMRTEAELSASEARFRTLVESVPGVVYQCEVQFPYRDLFLSEGVRDLTGYGPEEFLRPGGLTVGDLMHPEDRPQVEATAARAVEDRLPYQVHYRVRHASGEIRWVQEQGRAAYDTEGHPRWLDGVMIDITARMRAEEALRASELRLMEAQRITHTGSWELDLGSMELIWSEEAYRIYGLDPAARPETAELARNGIHPDDRRLVSERLWASVRDHTTFAMTHRVMTPDGRTKYVQQQAETVYRGDGTPVRIIGAMHDVTDRMQAEEARAALEMQLRQAQKMEAIGTLAGGIAHDFNNILAAVIGHAELLAQDLPPDHHGQDGVAGILSASRRARDLVQQILTFSRLQEQARRPILLDPVVSEALDLLRASLPATIEIRRDLDSPGALILADAVQIHQVVMNLSTNAAHAMREADGVLEVRSRVLEVSQALAGQRPGLRAGRWVSLEVTDTGHGMDQATLERIFDPFFSTKGPGEGTGLGLAVVHGIMQSHEGVVLVTSDPGHGTRFELYFPAPPMEVALANEEESRLPRGHGQRILVVDDEPALVRIATRTLERLGYRVTAHTHGPEAVADFLTRPHEFDLVFTDLTMPQVDGVELAARVLERRPEIPVLLTSGYTGALDPQRLQRLGIRELVGKPFQVRTLAEAVARHLGSA